MFKYFSTVGKRIYYNVLDKLIDSYNNTYHRSIKMAPNQVNLDNSKEVFKNLYGFNNKREMLKSYKNSSIKKNDTVRIAYSNNKFDRGYYPNWTDETFKVTNVIKNSKPMIKLKTYKNEPLNKRFYKEEIQKVSENTLFRVEKILKQKYINKIKHYFVKWLNFDNSHNSWIKASDITTNQNG